MTVALESVDLVFDRQPNVDMQHIMYFVKRASYELAFVVRQTLQAEQRERICCHVRLKTTCQTGAFVLDRQNLVQFYEDLAGMMEYVQNERGRSQTPVPPG